MDTIKNMGRVVIAARQLVKAVRRDMPAELIRFYLDQLRLSLIQFCPCIVYQRHVNLAGRVL